jgi:hypothetical protein
MLLLLLLLQLSLSSAKLPKASSSTVKSPLEASEAMLLADLEKFLQGLACWCCNMIQLFERLKFELQLVLLLLMVMVDLGKGLQWACLLLVLQHKGV